MHQNYLRDAIMGNFYFVFICLHFPVFSNGHVLTFMIIKLHLTKWELVQKSTIKQVIDCNVLLFIKLQNCCQYTHFWGGEMCSSQVCAFAEHKQNISIPFSWSSSHLALVAKPPKIAIIYSQNLWKILKKTDASKRGHSAEKTTALKLA